MSATFDVAGRVALVTGAAQGIGHAVARQLLDRGASVVRVDRDQSALATFGDEESRALSVVADVTDRAAMASAVRTVVERFGRLDVVVANAGVTPTPATVRTMDLEDYERVVNINQIGVLNTVKPALEPVIAQQGHIVVVASCAAFTPGIGGAAYMSSKAAAEQLGRTLRLELAPHRVSVGVASFGFVETALASATLDDDPLGRKLDAMLGWPLNHRISADAAAATIVDGITRRAASTVAPARWRPYSALRGLVNPLADRRLARDRRVHDLVRELEARADGSDADGSD